MKKPSERRTNAATRERRRGIALLAFAGRPTDDVRSTMFACAENLERELVTASVPGPRGGVIATEQQLTQIAAAVRSSGAAVVAVAGSTSTRIVRRLAAATRRPVLVARTRQHWARILAATDLQSPSLPIMAAASSVAATLGADSLVLHNVAPSWSPPGAGSGVAGRMASGVARRVRRLLRTAARSAPRSKVIVSCSAEPERAILDAFVAREADLLVLGMRRPNARWGPRCADHVVATTPGNVLVVPIARRRSPIAKGEKS